MFTGLVQSTGRIVRAAPRGDGLRIAVEVGALDLADVKEGDSIAVAGCCLTVVATEGNTLCFDVSAETMRCTAGLDGGTRVNLEKALRLSDRLGGHWLSGHIDGVGTVEHAQAVGAADGSRLLEIDAPQELARYIAAKGAIAVDGVSLTVNRVDGCRFATNLIPHTLEATTLGELVRGDRVNLEIDLVARYIERLVHGGF
jgi:riboflavin synthase